MSVMGEADTDARAMPVTTAPVSPRRSCRGTCSKSFGTFLMVPATLFLTLNGCLTVLLVDLRPRLERRWHGCIGRACDEEEDLRFLLAATTLYSLCALLMYWSYFMAAFSDPGTVPSDIQTADHKWNALGCACNADFESAWDYCDTCRHYCPPRSYHCAACGICVFHFDHHCLLINNCVGRCNRRYFVQFLSYLTLFCLATGLAPWPGFSDSFAEQEIDFWLGSLSSLRLPADHVHAISLIAFPGVLGWLLKRIWLTGWGLTSEECCGWMASCCQPRVYDRGCDMNWADTMGTSLVRYILPLPLTPPGLGRALNLDQEDL